MPGTMASVVGITLFKQNFGGGIAWGFNVVFMKQTNSLYFV